MPVVPGLHPGNRHFNANPETLNNVAIPLAVGLGGFVGAIGRYYVSQWVARCVPGGLAFLGTFCVNLIGCFLIGLLVTAVGRVTWMTPLVQRCLLTGVLGSLTTFSTFSFEAVTLLHDDRTGAALLYVGSSVAAGLFLVWLGMAVGQQMFPAAG